MELACKLAGNNTLEVDEYVYFSEKETGNKNRALSYMLKAYGLIQDPTEWESVYLHRLWINMEIVLRVCKC